MMQSAAAVRHTTEEFASARVLETVQLGKGWFSEESGGLNRYYADLLRQLPGVGVSVRGLVAGSRDVPRLSAGAARAFAPRRAGLPLRLHGVREQARRALMAAPGSVAVAHFALYAAPCLDLFRSHPFVMHFHGPWAAESRAEGAGAAVTRMKQALERAVYRRAARVIVLSKAFGSVIAEQYGVPPDWIRVIPGGVDVRRFSVSVSRSEARARLGWPNDRPVVFVVRRLVRRMGLENLIAAMTEVRAAVPDALLLVAGTGPLAGELEARCRDANLGQHVRLLGFVPDEDLPFAYRAADLSIVPSVALEGFGLIVAESLAAGTPVLVTGVGGLPETLEEFAPQCIVREQGPRALAGALVDALRARTPLPTPDTCRYQAYSRFDWSVVASRVRDVYTEALQ